MNATPDSTRRKRTVAVVLAAIALVIAAGVVYAIARDDGSDGPEYPPVERAPVSEAKKRPNIVFIYTDDQDPASFKRRYMPRTFRLLVDEGTLFTESIAATPLCCPSRVNFITGNYAHRSGVFRNNMGYQHVISVENTLGAWMQHAGYRTAWIGKFLQGFKKVDDPTVPAPGWDEWAISLRAKYYDWKLFTNDEGKVRGGTEPEDYYTDEITRRSVDFLDRQLRDDRPAFLVMNQLAPHKGKGGKGRCAASVAPAPGDLGRYEKAPLPRGPSFNRFDPNKTAFPIGEKLDRKRIEEEHDRYRCRLESLLGVDRAIAEVVETVERHGELDNTVFVFTTDNSLLLGEHAIKGKGFPYEEGLRTPLAIRVPDRLLGRPAVDRVDELVANVDLTATLLALADARPCRAPGECRKLDGLSLVPLLEGRTGQWPKERAIPIEGGGDKGPCGYRGLRLPDEVLLQRVDPDPDGEGCVHENPPEYYDLKADPFQLENLVATRPDAVRDRVDELLDLLGRLDGCAGLPERGGTNDCD